MTDLDPNTMTDAHKAVLEAVGKGLERSGVNISASVFPNVAGAIVACLFDDDHRIMAQVFGDECDSAAKAARSQAPAIDTTPPIETVAKDPEGE